ncbi:9926_t:CDS:2, partial [Gigaspora margarita]
MEKDLSNIIEGEEDSENVDNNDYNDYDDYNDFSDTDDYRELLQQCDYNSEYLEANNNSSLFYTPSNNDSMFNNANNNDSMFYNANDYDNVFYDHNNFNDIEEGTKNYHIDKGIYNSVSISQNNVSESIKTFNDSAIPEDRLSIIPKLVIPSNFIPNKRYRFHALQDMSNDPTYQYNIYYQVANKNFEDCHSKMENQMHTRYKIHERVYKVGDLVKIQIAKIDRGPASEVVPLGPKEFPELDDLLINKTISIVEAARLQSNSFASDKECN